MYDTIDYHIKKPKLLNQNKVKMYKSQHIYIELQRRYGLMDMGAGTNKQDIGVLVKYFDYK